jgi:hypothetical protein
VKCPENYRCWAGIDVKTLVFKWVTGKKTWFKAISVSSNASIEMFGECSFFRNKKLADKGFNNKCFALKPFLILQILSAKNKLHEFQYGGHPWDRFVRKSAGSLFS